MERTNYAEDYKNIAKKYGGNLVSTITSALKKLDAERDPDKILALTQPAMKALKGAIDDLKDVTPKDKATAFSKELGGLSDKIKLRTQAAKIDAHEAADAEKKQADAEKAAGGLAAQLANYDGVLVKLSQTCVAKHKEVWTAIERLSDKRMKCLKSLGKEYGLNASEYRGSAIAIASMMAAEAKEPSGKGRKGTKQTIGGSDEEKNSAAEVKSLRNEFIEYCKSECKSELGAVIKDLDALDDAYELTLKTSIKVFLLIENIEKQVKKPKVTGACNKVKGGVENLNDALEKAREVVVTLLKQVRKEGGLGEEDGAYRDTYQEIPPVPIDALHKQLQSLKAEL
jgi:hypothetical protein